MPDVAPLAGPSQTLATCPLGAQQVVEALPPHLLTHATRRRLAELGIRPGARLVALSATAGAGRVIAVSEARIALDRATALAVHVVPEHVPDLVEEA